MDSGQERFERKLNRIQIAKLFVAYMQIKTLQGKSVKKRA